MLALDCSLLRFKPFPLIKCDRSDLSSAKCMHSNTSSSIMAIALPNCSNFVFNLLMSFERCSGCLSVSLLSFFFFLRFKMELILQMWTFKKLFSLDLFSWGYMALICESAYDLLSDIFIWLIQHSYSFGLQYYYDWNHTPW